MRMEARNITFPQTKTILQGVNVPNVQLDDIQAILKISRAGVYTLMHRVDFPTIRIGKRMLVPEDKFVQWLHEQSERGGDF